MAEPSARDKIAVTAALAILFVGIPMATCAADTPDGVSRREYTRTADGQKMRVVEASFDVTGERTFLDLYHWPHVLQKVYPLATGNGYVVVVYRKHRDQRAWHVNAKTWCQDGMCS